MYHQEITLACKQPILGLQQRIGETIKVIDKLKHNESDLAFGVIDFDSLAHWSRDISLRFLPIANFDSFLMLQQDLLRMRSFYKKLYDKQVTVIENYPYLFCNYHEIALNACSETYEAQYAKSRYYVEGYFHRLKFTYDSFTSSEKERLKLIWDYMTLAKIIQFSSEKELISYNYIFNGFSDSLMPLTPSSKANLTAFSPYQTCMPGDFTEPYDPRCREWYQAVTTDTNPRAFYFSKPYSDSFTKNIIMSGSTQLLNDAGEFLTVVSFDFAIQNLITHTLGKSTTSLESNPLTEQYSVLFHKSNNTIFHHRYWRFDSQVERRWEDLEFNETSMFPEDKVNFIDEIERTKNFSLTGNFSISEGENTDQFYQSWSRNNVSYFSLVYPVEVLNLWDIYPKSKPEAKQVVFLARVHRDLRNILKSYNVIDDPIFQWVFVSEIVFVFLLVLIFSLHYAAILNHQVYIPIQSLTRFLKIHIRRTAIASQNPMNQNNSTHQNPHLSTNNTVMTTQQGTTTKKQQQQHVQRSVGNNQLPSVSNENAHSYHFALYKNQSDEHQSPNQHPKQTPKHGRTYSYQQQIQQSYLFGQQQQQQQQQHQSAQQKNLSKSTERQRLLNNFDSEIQTKKPIKQRESIQLNHKQQPQQQQPRLSLREQQQQQLEQLEGITSQKRMSSQLKFQSQLTGNRGTSVSTITTLRQIQKQQPILQNAISNNNQNNSNKSMSHHHIPTTSNLNNNNSEMNEQIMKRFETSSHSIVAGAGTQQHLNSYLYSPQQHSKKKPQKQKQQHSSNKRMNNNINNNGLMEISQLSYIEETNYGTGSHASNSRSNSVHSQASLGESQSLNAMQNHPSHVLDFEPMFEEIMVISQTFFLLQELISYKSVVHDSTAASLTDSIIHFAHARQTFKLLKNTQGEVESLVILASFLQSLVSLEEESIAHVSTADSKELQDVSLLFDGAMQLILNDFDCANVDQFEHAISEGALMRAQETDYALMHCCLTALLSKAKFVKETAIAQLARIPTITSRTIQISQESIETKEIAENYLRAAKKMYEQAHRVNEQIRRARTEFKRKKTVDFEYERIMHIPTAQQMNGVHWELIQADIAEIEFHLGFVHSARATVRGLECLAAAAGLSVGISGIGDYLSGDSTSFPAAAIAMASKKLGILSIGGVEKSSPSQRFNSHMSPLNSPIESSKEDRIGLLSQQQQQQQQQYQDLTNPSPVNSAAVYHGGVSSPVGRQSEITQLHQLHFGSQSRIEVLRYRIAYLYGLDAQRRMDFHYAIRQFTSLCEDWRFYDPLIQKKVIVGIQSIAEEMSHSCSISNTLGSDDNDNDVLDRKLKQNPFISVSNFAKELEDVRAYFDQPADIMFLIEEQKGTDRIQLPPFGVPNNMSESILASAIHSIRKVLFMPGDRVGFVKFVPMHEPVVVQALTKIPSLQQEQRVWELIVADSVTNVVEKNKLVIEEFSSETNDAASPIRPRGKHGQASLEAAMAAESAAAAIQAVSTQPQTTRRSKIEDKRKSEELALRLAIEIAFREIKDANINLSERRQNARKERIDWHESRSQKGVVRPSMIILLTQDVSVSFKLCMLSISSELLDSQNQLFHPVILHAPLNSTISLDQTSTNPFVATKAKKTSNYFSFSTVSQMNFVAPRWRFNR